MRKFGLAVLSLLLIISAASAKTRGRDTVPAGPKRTLDKIAAVVGASIILQSDIELQYANYLASGNQPGDGIKCYILQSLLTQKLLAQQAVIDSVTVKDD